jgi:uncharacterized protein
MATHDQDGPDVDPLRMLERGEALSGELDVRTLELVSESLAEGSEPVQVAWRIAGGFDDEGRPALALTLQGVLPLTCQRCLEAFAWPLRQETRMLVARNDAELAALDETTDDEVILGSKQIGAYVLVEDELVLSIPFAPVHPDACP